ncbi:MAG: hypothetical protein KGL39_07405 [Patescibacteria group bacterium]|nr:hypothetical protein [Patescibacteria group bacterium]
MAGNILDVDALAAQYDAQNQAYAKQAAAAAQARQAQEQAAKQPPTLATVGTQDRGHVTPGIIDGILNEVGQWGTAARHVGQDVMAGAATAAGNAMDMAKSAGSPADPNDPANAPAPVWDHAREAIGDFRDAMVVQDPTGVDPVIQAGAQLALPFAAYSKALSALHGISNIVAAGAATDVTALAPHDMRTADLIRLGQATDTKIGAALRAIGPYGLNAYINYLADRTNETEAQGRFKNALDGLGANLILTPLLHAAGIVVKQGVAATRYAAENGIRNTVSDLASAAPKPVVESPPAPDVAIDTRPEAEALNNEPAAQQLQRTLLANAKTGSTVPAGELIESLRKGLPDTPEGKFFSDILSRLAEKKLATPVSGFNSYYDKATGGQIAARTYRGQYFPPNMQPGSAMEHGAVHIYPAALTSAADTVKTFTHEMVHAATYQELNSSPFVSKALEVLRAHGKEQFGDLGKAMYGFTNKHEFVAEIESNPGFQRAMRRTPMGDGRSVWEHYRDTVAGLLGVGSMTAAGLQMFDQLLTKEEPGA